MSKNGSVRNTPYSGGDLDSRTLLKKNLNCEPCIFLTVLKNITKIALYQRYIFLPTFFNKVVFLIFNEYFSLSSSDYPTSPYL